MPRPQMKGAGSMAMGGGGKKPRTMPSSMMGTPPGTGIGGKPMMGGGSGAGPGTMGPRSAPGSGTAAFKKGGPARPGKKEREEEKKEHVSKHEKGGMVSKHEVVAHHAETAKHHAKEAMEHGAKKEHVSKHAHGGPVIAGHSTHGGGHGTGSHEHPREQGISKGSDGRRGGVKGGGLDPISSQTSNAKARVGMHKKAT